MLISVPVRALIQVSHFNDFFTANDGIVLQLYGKDNLEKHLHKDNAEKLKATVTRAT